MHNQVFVALLAGLALSVQATINAGLAARIGGAFAASTVSFIVATLVLVAFHLVQGKPLPDRELVASVPLVFWLGGLLGAMYVTGAISSVGALGTSAAICLILAGQVVGALAIDYFGILSGTAKVITPMRLFGACLAVTGAMLAVTN